MDHIWHTQMSQYDGTREADPAPDRPEGEDVANELEGLRPITHEEMGIRRDLHPTESNGKIVLTPACYSMTKDEKKKLC
ncbi:hypothetical protein Dsin_008663 [Dipteronia sinensis]|uniref:Uncharacterized protein n=1 Tax=Dipteronia sinensis TaxID=43782 RepID=A0AAE0AP44_9ROSI|nr:hypothetical protein Dsin_008663 [Dipteronia sinensis]